MSETRTLLVLSDVHYAGESERRRGHTEFEVIRNSVLRTCVRAYRHFIWKRNPFAHNHLLDRFLECAGEADYVIANGDYSCDSAFIGVSDRASCESANQCLDKLRSRFGPKLRIVLGDHELGKLSLFGGCGGMRLASWRDAQLRLGAAPFWTVHAGRYVLIGVTSSLLAYPVLERDALTAEQNDWKELSDRHLALVRQAFASLRSDQRVVLFCHDPTALPFLWRDEIIRSRLSQVDLTMIGHLHSGLVLWKSRLLSGMPTITFLGNSIRRMSAALHEAKLWRPFRVALCPALSGIELLKDGGYTRIVLDEQHTPARSRICRL